VQRVAIIGGGPAGTIAADRLADTFEVHLFEQGRTLGRKFLVAGEGGLNITNSVINEELLAHYSPANFMHDALRAFGSLELRAWLSELGISTYIGSSGRVFPERVIKPAEVLKAIITRIKEKGVRIHTGHRFVGFDVEARPMIEHAGARTLVEADRYLFALGGASWSKTGSTGEWIEHFGKLGVALVPFQASNCGVEASMPETLRVHAGKPLKNIAVSCGERRIRGEVMITSTGLEGNAIYPIVPLLREGLSNSLQVEIVIDLKPDLSTEQLEHKLQGAAWKERVAALRLDRAAVALLKGFTPLQRYLDGRTLAHDVKNVHVPITGLRSMEEAISTVGGVAMDEIAADLSLKKYPHLFVAGEMLDWDAPTGGFLLQGAFSLGNWAAQGIAASCRSV